MRFGTVQKSYFGASDGAYSLVTKREVYDSQITLTGEEVELAISHFGSSGIHTGPVKSDREAASKKFLLYTASGETEEISANLVFPKPSNSELRLYLSKKSFMPKEGQIWFIYVTGRRLCIGAMDEMRWRSLGRDDAEDDHYISSIYNEIKLPQYIEKSGSLILRRDPRLALKRFKAVKYKCEADPSHSLFIARATGLPFLEAHHLLPLRYQNDFTSSLDIEENIVALCPHCHRLIHHATVDMTKLLLDSLFKRHRGLNNHFNIDSSALYRLYNCEDILAS
jgi:hypothetical protein